MIARLEAIIRNRWIAGYVADNRARYSVDPYERIVAKRAKFDGRITTTLELAPALDSYSWHGIYTERQ